MYPIIVATSSELHLGTPSPLQVQIIQPVIPHYRVPLFRALAKIPHISIAVHASPVGPRSMQSAVTTGGIYIIDYEMKSLLGGRAYWQAGLRLSQSLGRGDVLVVSGNLRALNLMPLLFQAKARGIGIVWWGHGWTANASRATAAVRRLIMRAMDVLLLYSDAEVEEFRRRGFNRRRLFATNNAIDQEPIALASNCHNSQTLDSFRATMDLTERRVLLFCGRLSSKTQLDVGLRALSQLVQYDKSYTLAVIGDGPLRDKHMKLAVDLGLENNVIWLGAMFNQSDMAPWFLIAESFIYPGAIGLSLMHAFGYGLPVITHDNLRNQMPEIAALKPGVNGLLFKEGSAKDLVAAITKLSNNLPLRNAMSREAKQTVEVEYSLPSMVGRFERAIIAASRLKRA